MFWRGQWLWEETQVQEVVSSNPYTGYLKDHSSHLLAKIDQFYWCLKISKMNEKEAGDDPF